MKKGEEIKASPFSINIKLLVDLMGLNI